MIYFMPKSAEIDPHRITAEQVERLGVAILGIKEKEMPCDGQKFASGGFLRESAPAVTIADLFAVYPEIREAVTGTEEEVATKLQRAAQLARAEDALEELRSPFTPDWSLDFDDDDDPDDGEKEDLPTAPVKPVNIASKRKRFVETDIAEDAA